MGKQIKTHRGIVMSTKGVVASAHPLISMAGIKILQKGGNAMDAAIAMGNLSGLALPQMCGLGGDAFILYYDHATKQITAINGSGASPKKATIDYFKSHGYTKIPDVGMLSLTMPGYVSAAFLALKTFGTMSFSALCDDVIDYARNGIPLSESVHKSLVHNQAKMQRYNPSLYKRFSHEDGTLLELGERYFNSELADTFELLKQGGEKAFYEGPIAERIVAHSQKHGGLLEIDDLKQTAAELLAPICVHYRDRIVYTNPPVSQGIILLEELSILHQFDLGAASYNSAESVHWMVEAKKLSFHDRECYFADPKFNENPIDACLSKDYAQRQSKRICLDRCLDVEDGINANEIGDTTSFAVVDQEGNAVSFITSIFQNFGSFEEVEGCGFILNDRGSMFVLDDHHPNCLQPGKKTMHTLMTYMITDLDGSLRYVGNTPGGDSQYQWNLQTIVNLLDYGMDVQEALEAPKWSHAQRNALNKDIEEVLKIEADENDPTVLGLRAKGHKVECKEYGCMGIGELIEVKKDGVLFAASDGRADGCAMPQ